MNAELLALIENYQAWLEAKRTPEADRLWALFESRVQDVLQRQPGLTPESLLGAVRFAHDQWLKAEDKLRQKRLTT